jgi:hypothetical protein
MKKWNLSVSDLGSWDVDALTLKTLTCTAVLQQLSFAD